MGKVKGVVKIYLIYISQQFPKKKKVCSPILSEETIIIAAAIGSGFTLRIH